MDGLSGWGQLYQPGRETYGENLENLTKQVALSRGLARSYGDSALPPPGDPVAANTTLADRFLGFDPETGLLRAEAGTSLLAINDTFLPRRWFLPTTPGTQFVTLGGAVASDVHGKNHHEVGCFGEHVTWLKLRLASGEVVECSLTEESELFRATIGGMGLTGHILEVEFRMVRIPSTWIVMESERVENIDDYVRGLADAARDWPFTMGWIDCVTEGKQMGRGILMKGRWAEPPEVKRGYEEMARSVRVPMYLPDDAINPRTVKLFNTAYYWSHIPKKKSRIVHPKMFFYPLDALEEWYRLYGRRGFTQYQCVLPLDGGVQVAREFMKVFVKSGCATPLCVIKDCGAEGAGMLSFPKPGISIAVDMPVGPDTQQVVDGMNEFVIANGGRIYLAKDAFTRAEHYRAMDPRVEEFLAARAKWDPERKIRSAQSVRMFGDPALLQFSEISEIRR